MFHRTCVHIIFSSVWVAEAVLMSIHTGLIENQRTNGPVNAHLISVPSKSTKQTKHGNKYEKDLINNS